MWGSLNVWRVSSAGVGGSARAEAAGSDRIRLSSRLIPNGEASRIEVDEGVIKLIADAVMLYRDAEFGAAAFDKE